MNRVLSSAAVVAGLVCTLGGTASWGGPPTPAESSRSKTTPPAAATPPWAPPRSGTPQVAATSRSANGPASI